ncbi:MAG: heme-binding domain-containing protein [Pirellulaceae bacterium]|nr:heme-binding domain-containing protein [Pirellulaceae bacterium]
MKSKRWLILTSALLLIPRVATPADTPESAVDIYAKDNLVAWCIVPFDGKKRGPAERAAMCAKLGLKQIAYDWRAEHVPTFEQEILEYQKHELSYFAFWGVHEEAFGLFEKYDLHPQIWTMLAAPVGETDKERVRSVATQLVPLVKRTRKMGCKLGLYNHGGWGGEPENMVAVCEFLKQSDDGGHVGIVYNQHHAHDRIDDFAKIVDLMKPHLLCLNLNGMTRDGDRRGQKILPLGEGEFDVALLKTIRDSGYQGPIGIIGHTQDDVEMRLRDNLDGLAWIRPQLDGRPAGPKPTPRTWSPMKPSPTKESTNVRGTVLKGQTAFRTAPLTVECRVMLPRRDGYNILVASDGKNSGAHWEIFTVAGSGLFTAYTPGLTPDHTRSKLMLCDGKPHNVAMVLEPDRLRLYVDGKVVADQPVKGRGKPIVPGDLGIGQLVEGQLGCSGPVDWVRLSNQARSTIWTQTVAPPNDESTLLSWQAEVADPGQPSDDKDKKATMTLWGPTPKYSPELVTTLAEAASTGGDAARGMLAFATAKSACLSCHQIGSHGGTVGPALTEIGKQGKPHEIIESVFWPKRQVKPEHVAHVVVTSDGHSHNGYILKEDTRQIVLRDPTKGLTHEVTIPLDGVEARREIGSLMPEHLTAAMSSQQVKDLLKFLMRLGRADGIPLADIDSVLQHATAHQHGPADFPHDRDPLEAGDWPLWKAPINRDRLYDFYAKEADYFRGVAAAGASVPPLLKEFPGLDGGTFGHWGNQNEQSWASDAWNDVKLGSVQAGIFRGAGVTIPRGVCVQLGDNRELACCFNPDTLTYDAVWKGGFLKFSSVRHGFLDGLLMDGTAVPFIEKGKRFHDKQASDDFEYEGFHRFADRIGFAYRIGEKRYLDMPWIGDGQFKRNVSTIPFNSPPLRVSGSRQWPETIETAIRHGGESPYAIDTIEMPTGNPWNVPLFGGGLGFLEDGSALLCTMHGDVWRITGFAYPSKKATWTRFASGLHHCQGMVVDSRGIFVLGRDQITRLHDTDQNGEADFYQCFSNAYQTSAAGHDFVCGLERDSDGYFYTSSGNQGVVRISPNGKRAEVIATGFRNPDGIGLTADGLVTVPCSEGSWTPASMICAFGKPADDVRHAPPFFGYHGPKNGERPELPLVYLPRGLDNSSGGQQVVNSDRWGPLRDQLLHFSFGTGSHFLLLRDEVDGQLQGAVVPLRGEFLSGVHRGRFFSEDGQLYVTGMQGWGSYATEPGCFQRVRYTGAPVQLPVAFKVHRNGVLLTFSESLDRKTAGDATNHFAQCWNYRYSSAYGSPEFSTRHAGMRGHDHVAITSAHIVGDGRSLFLEMPGLQPVNQLHLRIQSAPEKSHELFVTVHKLAKDDFTGAAGLRLLRDKVITPHPILSDLAMATRSVANPHAPIKPGGRKITIETGSNLSFAIRSVHVVPGELIEFTLSNPDVVPHNWALVKPGTLKRVGDLANRLISDPEAAIGHYIPESTDVLAYTNVVLPKEQFTIYFNAPDQPGHYPFLCTFPGHWRVMNGEMIVGTNDN